MNNLNLPPEAFKTSTVTRQELALCRNGFMTRDELYQIWFKRKIESLRDELIILPDEEYYRRVKHLKARIWRKMERLLTALHA